MKNRLVGILVLLLVAVIAWPMLFEQDIDEPVDITPQITQQPSKLEEVEISSPQGDLFAEEEIMEAQKALESGDKPEPLPEEKKAPSYAKTETIVVKPKSDAPRAALNEQGAPISWTLQLASFSENNRAQKLLNDLHAKGYKAYIRQSETGKGKRFRVYAGPSFDRQALEKTQQAIDKNFKVQSLIIRFSAE